jgi:transposase-like protein
VPPGAAGGVTIDVPRDRAGPFAHFAEVYGASISRDTISRITDRVVEEMQAWTSRPLVPVHAAVFIDAIP